MSRPLQAQGSRHFATPLIAALGDSEILRWLYDMLYGTTELKLVSRYALEESVKRLAAVARCTGFMTQGAVGRVSASYVRLRRSRLLFRNDFRPVFVGEFHEVDGRAILRGRFGLSSFTKLFMTFWLGFCALWTLLAAATALMIRDPVTWWLPSAGAGMFGLGVAFMAGAKRLSEGDVEWLSGLMREALGVT